MNHHINNVLGVITNTTQNIFQRNVIHGIRDIVARRGYELAVQALDEQSGDFEWKGMRGVFVIANILSDEQLKAIYSSGTPLSLVSHQVMGLPIPALTANNIEGISQLVAYMVETCKRREFVFIRGDMQQNDAIQREDAFRRELMRYNLPIREEFFIRGDFIAQVAAESLTDLLNIRRDFDAIIAADYLMAVAALDVLAKAGIRVPEDVSVVGFGDGQEAEAVGLTTVAADVVELGRRAARQLIGQIEGLRIRGLTLLSTELVIRQTCKPRAQN
jgi:DNA-binding LacI/PurR family transcriptional regulator